MAFDPRRPDPDRLGRLPFGFRWCSRFVLLSAQAGESEIKKARRGWRVQDGLRQLLGGARHSGRNAADGGGGGRPLSMEGDADAALALSESGQVRFLAYTATLVLYEDDAGRADANARELLRVLNDLGFTGRVEGVNAVDAFWGSLPGLFYPNLRRPVLHTGNLGQLFPSTALWAGEEHNPSPLLPLRSPPLMIAETAGSTPFRLNTDTDTSGNALVLGPPGAGKSLLASCLPGILPELSPGVGADMAAFDRFYKRLIAAVPITASADSSLPTEASFSQR